MRAGQIRPHAAAVDDDRRQPASDEKKMRPDRQRREHDESVDNPSHVGNGNGGSGSTAIAANLPQYYRVVERIKGLA
jgi:hypothetical protein